MTPDEIKALIASLQTAADTLQESVNTRNDQIQADRDDIVVRQAAIDSDNEDITTQQTVVDEDEVALGYVNDTIAKLQALVQPAPAPSTPPTP